MRAGANAVVTHTDTTSREITRGQGAVGPFPDLHEDEDVKAKTKREAGEEDVAGCFGNPIGHYQGVGRKVTQDQIEQQQWIKERHKNGERHAYDAAAGCANLRNGDKAEGGGPNRSDRANKEDYPGNVVNEIRRDGGGVADEQLENDPCDAERGDTGGGDGAA